MRLELSELARGVEPDEAAAWWSDFREGREDHAFVPGQRRRIVESRGGRVTMVDEVRPWGALLFRETTTAWREGMAVRFEGENPLCHFEGAYRFEAADGGTRVRLEADVRLKPALRAARRPGRVVASWILRHDLRHHVADLQRDQYH